MALRRWTSVLVTSNTPRTPPAHLMPSPGQSPPHATNTPSPPHATTRNTRPPPLRPVEKMEDQDEREREGGREIEECTKEGEEGVHAGGRGCVTAPHRSRRCTPSSWIPPPHTILVEPAVARHSRGSLRWISRRPPDLRAPPEGKETRTAGSEGTAVAASTPHPAVAPLYQAEWQ
jgi:hypothetical protein